MIRSQCMLVCYAQVTVVATDQGGIGPEIRSTSGTFYVRILDRNDSIPTFNSTVCNRFFDHYVQSLLLYCSSLSLESRRIPQLVQHLVKYRAQMQTLEVMQFCSIT